MAKVKPGIGNPHAQGPRPTLVLDLLTLTPPGSYPCFTKMIWNLPVQIRGDPSHMTIDYSATVDAALISSNFIGFSHKPWRKSFLKKRGDGGHWSSTTLIGPGQWESVKLTCLQSSWGAQIPPTPQFIASSLVFLLCPFYKREQCGQGMLPTHHKSVVKGMIIYYNNNT